MEQNNVKDMKHSLNQHKNLPSFQFANICRLCVQQNCALIGIQRKIEVNSESQGVFVTSLIHNCLDIKLNDEADYPIGICLECLDRLKFIYNFKELCKKNHEQYFRNSNLHLNETSQELTASIIKEEPICTHSVIKKHNEFDLLHELKPDTNARDRREEENRKNAQRQREKRANETLEERLLRTRRAAEQARKRRQKLRKENPEEYKKRLARAAELKRIRRSGLSYEEQKFEELNAALKESDQIDLSVHEDSELKDKIDSSKQGAVRHRLLKTQQNYELQPVKEEGGANFCYNNSESIGSWQSYSES